MGPVLRRPELERDPVGKRTMAGLAAAQRLPIQHVGKQRGARSCRVVETGTDRRYIGSMKRTSTPSGKRAAASAAKRTTGKAMTDRKAPVASASGRLAGAAKHPKATAKKAGAQLSSSARASASATATLDALLSRIHSDIDEADRLLAGAMAG